MTDPEFRQSLHDHLSEGPEMEKDLESLEHLMSEKRFKSYLLGELTPKEHLVLEELLWSDPQADEVFEMVEDELIEDYCNDALADHERERFDKFFVWTAERRQKRDLVENLKRFSAHKQRIKGRWSDIWKSVKAFGNFRNPVPAWSLVAALLLIIAGGPWLAMRDSSVFLALDSQLTRGINDYRKVEISSGTDLLKLELALEPEEYSRFQIDLKLVDDGDVLTRTFPRTESLERDRVLKFSISAEALMYGDYVLILSGAVSGGEFERIQSYYFRVIRD